MTITSVRRQIVDAVVDKLGRMSQLHGYNFDWSTGSGGGGAQKVRNVNETAVLPTVIVESSSEAKGPDFSNFILKTLEVTCAAIMAWDQSSDSTAIEDVIDAGAADVERALLSENENDPPLGVTGVERVDVVGTDVFVSDSNQLIGLVRAQVQYRHNSFDPNVYP